MTPQEIYELLKAEFNQKILSYQEVPKEAFVLIETSSLPLVASFLKTDNRLLLDCLMCLSGVDYPDRFNVVYHLFSTKYLHKLIIKVNTPKDNPIVPSVSSIWATAEAHERECYDLLGIEFVGHPNLRRILLPDDWEGYPLRKDYQYPASYHGIPS